MHCIHQTTLLVWSLPIDHLAGKYLSLRVTTSSPITFMVALHIGQIESFSISSKYRVSTGKFRLSKSSLIRGGFFFLNLVLLVVCFLSSGISISSCLVVCRNLLTIPSSEVCPTLISMLLKTSTISFLLLFSSLARAKKERT